MYTEDPDEFETRPAHRRIGTYLLGIFVAGLATSILIFTMAMQGMGWAPAILGARPAGQATFTGNSDVYLYFSRSTATYYASTGGHYDALVKPWRDYFAKTRQQAKEIQDLSGLSGLRSGVVILPSTAALGPAERQELLSFRERGGSLLATWATGTRGQNGEWAGWEFLEKLGEGKFAGEMPREAQVGQLVLNGESPVAFSQSAGKRIGLGQNAERPLRLSGSATAGQFLNDAGSPDPDRLSEGAILYSEAGPQAGRAVVFGFAESSWERQTADIHQLVDTTLSWLRHQPILLKAAWPYGRRAAHVVEMNAEQGFGNALAFARMLKDVDDKGAFYVLTSSAIASADVLRSLHKDFEIGYAGDTPEEFKGQPENLQMQRIANMQAQIQSMLPGSTGINGFRAPGESDDKTTHRLLLKAGIRRHLSGPLDSDARLPYFAPIADTDVTDGLIMLPRSQRDDTRLLTTFRDASSLSKAMIDDFNQTRDLGALGILGVHSQNFGEGQPMPMAMPAYLSYIRGQRESVWLAAPSEIDSWWRDRERFRLVVRPSGPRIEFDVAVVGGRPVKGASITVVLPRKKALPTISGVKPGMPVPELRLIDDFKATVIFQTLEPGNYFYQMTF